LDQAIQISREIGDQSNVCSVLEILSRNAHGQGNDRLALEYTNDWLKIAQEGGFRMLEGQALFAKGYALLGLGDLMAAEQAFKQSLEIRQELELPGRVIESKGGLVNLALTKGELAGARQDVEDILRDLNLDGSQGKNAAPVDELEGPLLLYMTCYRYLSATGDRRAGLVLEHAYSRLQERAAYLDPEDRASYMENIPLHRELVAACQAALERQKEG
jgi:tetratricopeptide (TPR) repeat protein